MNNFFDDFLASTSDYYNNLITFLPKMLLATLVFFFFYFLANRSKRFVGNRLVKSMDDPLLATFLSRIAKIGMILIGLLFAMQVLDLAGLATGLITGASVSAIVIGFAFKDIGENFLAGIMLAFNRPFKIGDTVELDGYKGVVVGLSLRNSRIKTFDGKDIFIPNADVVKNPVVNYTMDGFLRHQFNISLDIDSNLNEAISIIRETVKQVQGIELEDKAITISVENTSSNTLTLTIYYWLDTFDKSVSAIQVKNEAIEKVAKALSNAGFYLPSDVLEIKNYRTEQLKTTSNFDDSTLN